MIVRGIFYALIFIVAVFYAAVVFDLIYLNLDLGLANVEENARAVLNSSVIDKEVVDRTFNVLSTAVWVVPLSAIGLLLVWGLHTRRR